MTNGSKNCTIMNNENAIPQKGKLMKKGPFFNPVESIVIFLLLTHCTICEVIDLPCPKWKNFIPTITNHIN